MWENFAHALHRAGERQDRQGRNLTMTATTRTKMRPHGDQDPANGSAITLPRRTILGSPLRIGTLSWDVENSPSQSPGELLASLKAAAESWGVCDLAVAAGLTASSPESSEGLRRKFGPLIEKLEISSGFAGFGGLLTDPPLTAHGGISSETEYPTTVGASQAFDRTAAGSVAEA